MGVVPVQLQQVVDGQQDADDIDKYPQEVNDVMSEWSLDQWAGWFPWFVIDICRHGSTQKCWSQVDGNARKPKLIVLALQEAITRAFQHHHLKKIQLKSKN